MRTEQTPCRYRERGCSYVDTSLKSTRLALECHKLRCEAQKISDYPQWFKNCRYWCVCGDHFDIGYKSKHYSKCPGIHLLTPPKRHVNKNGRSTKATTIHSILYLHFTCPADQLVKNRRLRSFFKGITLKEYSYW